jgi:hypothetical protein
MATKRIEYHAMEDTLLVVEGFPPQWRVEAMNPDTGEVYIALFDGPGAQMRAVEYAKFKNGLMLTPLETGLTLVKTGTNIPLATTGKLAIRTEAGDEMILYLDGIYWTQDKKRRTVTAHERGSIVPAEDAPMRSLGA